MLEILGNHVVLGKRQEAIRRLLSLSNFLTAMNQRNVVINTESGTTGPVSLTQDPAKQCYL